jgi:hypothetical protein
LKFIYESPDNGKTVFQRPRGSNEKIKIKGDGAVKLDTIVTECGNIVVVYSANKENHETKI